MTTTINLNFNVWDFQRMPGLTIEDRTPTTEPRL